jgi:Mn-dependent DtxR family transcriptional regulator
MYNYEPLSSIVKKTEDVKNQYLKKIYDENDSNKRMYNTAQIAEEVGSFREFSAKLERRLAELKGSID